MSPSSGARRLAAGMGATVMPRKDATTQIRVTSHAPTTPRGLPGRSSWRGGARSFPSSARTVAVTSGSEKTAGRSRLTSNRRFASGPRPGWLRPREVRFSHTSANRSSRRPSRRPGDRPPTGANSSRRMTTAMSFKSRPTSCPVSTSEASERCRPRGIQAPDGRPGRHRGTQAPPRPRPTSDLGRRRCPNGGPVAGTAKP